MEIYCKTKSVTETLELGEKLSELLFPGDVVAMFGELGSGKTCLVRGICQGLNCADEVSSPTFTIINEYPGKYPVYHFDFYRIDSPQEIYDLGYEEYFYGDGVCLVEWSERASHLLPENRIEINLKGFFDSGRENERIFKILPIGDKIRRRSWQKVTNNRFCKQRDLELNIGNSI